MEHVKANNGLVEELFPHQMNKGSGKKGETRGAIRRWGENYKKYKCRDSVEIRTPNRAFIRKDKRCFL